MAAVHHGEGRLREFYAADDAQAAFVCEFVSAWVKVMDLDRFDVGHGELIVVLQPNRDRGGDISLEPQPRHRRDPRSGHRLAPRQAVTAPWRQARALLLLGLIGCEGAKGTTLHSCEDGAEAFLDDETYYRTIQVALDHALDGDVVHVCPGEHSAVLDVGTVNDANPLYHDGGTLTLAGDPDGSSVLNAGGKGAVLVTDRVSFTLTDLTFTRGTGFRYGDGADVPYYAVGGAIHDRGGADLSLVRVRIEGNRADDGRGAAFYVDGDPLHPNMVTLSDCAVLNNGPGSAAAFRTGYRFTATTTDWGEGSMDNQSRDIVLSTDDGEVGYDVPKGASVECDSVTDTCVFG